jgi:hypothetical protein
MDPNPWTRKVTVRWTNWTFGIYWGPLSRHYIRGIDLGPLEIVWTRKR